MKEEIIKSLNKVLLGLGIEEDVALDIPKDSSFGDYSTNIAMKIATRTHVSPLDLAEKISKALLDTKPECVESVSVAKPGFINIKIKDIFVSKEVALFLRDDLSSSKYSKEKNKIMVEFTDPNPFKLFHIGHIMSNSIGESIARLAEFHGNSVIRANWQGDVGLHVAKTVWAILQSENWQEKIKELEPKSLKEKVRWLGEMYVFGAKAYEEKNRDDISKVNEKIFKREDAVINMIYDIGRQWSLDYFEVVYATLGTKFDNYFFESKEGMLGEAVVKQNIEKGVFVESEGAIIFKGEDHGVHTRVFITSQGLPTYETKEIGLNTEKFRIYPDLEKSIIVTASEQNDYFKVLLKVFEIILPNIYTKTKHISHGMMRLSSGKMGSRKGNVVAGDDLIFEIENMVREKMKENDFPQEEKDKIAQDVAVSAIKYTILRQSIGNDIIFDSSASISFEGDSGPYLQYSAVRAGSVIRKAQADSQFGDIYEKAIKRNYDMPEKVGELERMIIRFFDVAQRSYAEYAPQLIAHYLIQLAGLYNSYYAKQVILDEKDPLSPYRLALTMTFEKIMKKGLWLLGIRTPERM